MTGRSDLIEHDRAGEELMRTISIGIGFHSGGKVTFTYIRVRVLK